MNNSTLWLYVQGTARTKDVLYPWLRFRFPEQAQPSRAACTGPAHSSKRHMGDEPLSALCLSFSAWKSAPVTPNQEQPQPRGGSLDTGDTGHGCELQAGCAPCGHPRQK